MTAPLTLGFDTSAAHCAAALLSGDRLLATRTEPMARGQAERLFPLLEDLLAGEGVTWADLARIGVGVGPGNFTGIRIAVAAARGLALSLEIPAIGVTTFDALSLDLPGPVVALVPAPQDRIYARTADGAPLLTTPEELAELDVAPGATWVGGPAAQVARTFAGTASDPRHPLPEAIARIAARAIPGAPPAPLYLRPADAAPPRDAPPVIVP